MLILYEVVGAGVIVGLICLGVYWLRQNIKVKKERENG